MKEELDPISWKAELRGKNANTMWTKIKGKLEKLVEANIPQTKTVNGRRSKPTWMNYKALKAVKRNTIVGRDTPESRATKGTKTTRGKETRPLKM